MTQKKFRVYLHDLDMYIINFHISKEGKVLVEDMHENGDFREVNATPEQWVGSLDSENEDVFENDIIEHVFYKKNPLLYPHGVVVLCNEFNCWGVIWGKNTETKLRVPFSEHKVIGNIHEHKHLLEGGV